MPKVYSDKEIAAVLLQLLNQRGDIDQSDIGIDSVEYVGQGCFTICVFCDDLEYTADS